MVRRMPPLPTTKDLLRMYQIKAKKSLSQNFIMDPTILTKFARTAGNLQDAYAVEVGPGPGGITRAILEEGVKELHVIEKDPRFLPSLNMIKEVAGSDRLRINIGDCLTYNVQSKLPRSLDQKKYLIIFNSFLRNVQGQVGANKMGLSSRAKSETSWQSTLQRSHPLYHQDTQRNIDSFERVPLRSSHCCSHVSA